ncbi:hypothetical protein [Allokutzneria albata]|uniref:Uncharacterized protein n=1 Tax=Allokutzneria albata TaxID=211114 RepID=A0A1H0DUW7_ALLAB|nr:hypothetical protein [Allokutzneria albata]SDN74047.1 hypothetical protein SAMN04489726_8012 [Allokutzneria albata]
MGDWAELITAVVGGVTFLFSVWQYVRTERRTAAKEREAAADGAARRLIEAAADGRITAEELAELAEKVRHDGAEQEGPR